MNVLRQNRQVQLTITCNVEQAQAIFNILATPPTVDLETWSREMNNGIRSLHLPFGTHALLRACQVSTSGYKDGRQVDDFPERIRYPGAFTRGGQLLSFEEWIKFIAVAAPDVPPWFSDPVQFGPKCYAGLVEAAVRRSGYLTNE